MLPRAVLLRALAQHRKLQCENVVGGMWLSRSSKEASKVAGFRPRGPGVRGREQWAAAAPRIPVVNGVSGARMLSSLEPAPSEPNRGHPERDAMRALLKAGDSKGVFVAFEKLKREGKAFLLDYNLALAAHAQLRAADSALDLFAEIESNASLGGADQHTYSTLANALCRAGRLEDACQLLDRMRASGLVPNIYMYNVLLSGTVQPRKVAIAQSLLREMETDGVVGDEFTLIPRLRLAARHKNAHDVKTTWEEAVQGLISNGKPCSRASISCLAVCYTKCNRPDLAEGALHVLARLSAGEGGKVRAALPAELYQAAGLEIPPQYRQKDAAGHVEEKEEEWKGQPTSMMQGSSSLASAGSKEGGAEAGQVPEEWGHDDYKKHLLSAFNSTMAAYDKKAHIPGVRTVKEMLDTVGVPPELSTHNANIHSRETHAHPEPLGLGGGNDNLDPRESVLERLEKWVANHVSSVAGHERTTQRKHNMVCAINSAMIVAEKFKGVNGVMRMWEQFSEHKLRPDVISWSIRLKAHASRYDVQEAWNVWQKMRDAGITPAEQTWVSLIAAHGKPRGVKKCRADDRVMQVIDEMEAANMPVTVPTGTAIMHVLGQLGKVDDLYRIFYLVKNCGEPLSVITYNVVMQNIADRGLGASAGVRLLCDMIQDGVQPDSITYNTLINSCSVPDELALANFFLAFQSASGLPCKADSFNVTLKCCIHSMDLEAARDILHDMEEMGVAANRATFATLLRALKEYPEMPIDEINWMLERAVVLGGRPSPEMIIDVIERCEDVRQSAFFLDICLRNRLLPPSKVLRMAEKIQERLAWERFDTNKLRQEAVAFFKKLVSEARAVVVGRLKTFRKPASADARFEHRPQNSG